MRRRIPRFCPKCGEPDSHATPETVWCTRCHWTAPREQHYPQGGAE